MVSQGPVAGDQQWISKRKMDWQGPDSADQRWIDKGLNLQTEDSWQGPEVADQQWFGKGARLADHRETDQQTE